MWLWLVVMWQQEYRAEEQYSPLKDTSKRCIADWLSHGLNNVLWSIVQAAATKCFANRWLFQISDTREWVFHAWNRQAHKNVQRSDFFWGLLAFEIWSNTCSYFYYSLRRKTTFISACWSKFLLIYYFHHKLGKISDLYFLIMIGYFFEQAIWLDYMGLLKLLMVE